MQQAILIDPHGTLERELLDGAIEAVAESQRLLTVDDVWNRIGIIPRDREEASKIGPAMQSAQIRGIIEPTQQYLRSRRVRSHGNLMLVWRSLVF